MGIGVDFDINVFEWEVAIAREAKQQYPVFFLAAQVIRRLRGPLEGIVETALRSSDEYDSLQNGELRENFGIVDATPALEDIIAAVKQSMELKAEPGSGSGGDLTVGVVRLSFFADDFARILAVALKSGSYVSVNKRGRQTLVPWLEWLLFGGDKILVFDHEINLEPHRGSRTGPIMLKPARGARGWRVPAAYSGTFEENWLTRTVESVLPEIQAAIIDGLSTL